ncbi:MAG: hypothetical protein CM15mP3_08240 [Candidatus Poseidoniales archaeon]|nr:MAG: hypothetical protein CM15mP3_08240 [Candidatus Poseidoniales archaeon]
MCSVVIEVKTHKSAGLHLVASKRPPSPVSKIKYFGLDLAQKTIAVRNVVSKNVGTIPRFSAVNLTVARHESNSLPLIGTPSSLMRSSIGRGAVMKTLHSIHNLG